MLIRGRGKKQKLPLWQEIDPDGEMCSLFIFFVFQTTQLPKLRQCEKKAKNTKEYYSILGRFTIKPNSFFGVEIH